MAETITQTMTFSEFHSDSARSLIKGLTPMIMTPETRSLTRPAPVIAGDVVNTGVVDARQRRIAFPACWHCGLSSASGPFSPPSQRPTECRHSSQQTTRS